jgi:23S rRNA (cytosine1962-C5)-methyltransferase
VSGLVVKPRARIFHGHEWVYAADVQKIFGHPEPGSIVSLKDFKDRPLGSAIYNPQSQIVARRFSRHRETLDLPFFVRRLKRALARRGRMAGIDLSLCRMVWSESDGLPGVVLDRYGAHFALQTLTLAMDQRKALITEAIVEVFGAESVVERNDSAIRVAEGLPLTTGVLHGVAPAPFRVTTDAGSFLVDITGGQKTGIYLDQLDNYRDAGNRAAGRRVLDCFCNQGGFALACAKGGAAHVTAVDVSEPAIATARANAEVMGLADRIEFVTANVFDYLKARESAGASWDYIILDPPSFTRNKKSVGDALRGYKEIHLRSLKMLPNDGLLSTFCCSHHVSTGEFRSVIAGAAVDAKKTLCQLAFHQQRQDHPILPAVPETEYLRGYTFELLAAF